MGAGEGVNAPGRRVGTGTDRLAGWGIAALGAGLVAAALLTWWLADVTPFNTVVVTLPGVVTACAWLYLRRSDLGVELYPEVFKGAVAGAALLGGFILAVVLAQGGSIADAGPLVVFMTGVGCIAGVLVGTNRAQGHRAREQTRAVREERERLRFLNHLLRHNVLNKANIIKGKAGLAEADADGDVPHLETITEETDDMVDLIESIRVLVDAASGHTERRAVDLSTDLRAEVTAMDRAHEAADVHADVPDGLTVLADELLRYVFENLIHNAIVHNDADEPRVEVAASADGDEVEVTVTDDGPGIPDAEKEAVFDPEMGTHHGVGLHLVRTLVRAYGGTVTLSDAEARGTVVTVRLPRAL